MPKWVTTGYTVNGDYTSVNPADGVRYRGTTGDVFVDSKRAKSMADAIEIVQNGVQRWFDFPIEWLDIQALARSKLKRVTKTAETKHPLSSEGDSLSG